jgi:hypothetical protein
VIQGLAPLVAERTGSRVWEPTTTEPVGCPAPILCCKPHEHSVVRWGARLPNLQRAGHVLSGPEHPLIAGFGGVGVVTFPLPPETILHALDKGDVH